MSTREKMGRSNPDQRDLASTVLALTRAASAAHAKARKDAAAHPAQFVQANRPQLELDWDDPFSMQICSSEELGNALARARASGDENPAVEAFLSQLYIQPLERTRSQPPLLEALADLEVRFPNFRVVVEAVRQRTALALLPPRSPLHLSPILLDGPPGVGKTAFSCALATALGAQILTLQMAHASGSFELAGLDPRFQHGGPGLLVRTVALGRAVDPLVLLDEIDKIPEGRNHDPVGPLYTLLEPATAHRFIDDGIKLAVNMSHVRWVATTNDVWRLDAAIRSRFEIFHIAAPTLEEGRGIASRVYVATLHEHPWGRYFSPDLPDEVADMLARRTPRELSRELHNALGRAALEHRSTLCVTDFAGARQEARGPGFL